MIGNMKTEVMTHNSCFLFFLPFFGVLIPFFQEFHWAGFISLSGYEVIRKLSPSGNRSKAQKLYKNHVTLNLL